MKRSSSALIFLYQKLSHYLEEFEEIIPRCLSPVEQATAVVLEEDLQCLVEECEELMISEADLPSCAGESLELRSLTVIEEVESLLSRSADFDTDPAIKTHPVDAHYHC